MEIMDYSGKKNLVIGLLLLNGILLYAHFIPVDVFYAPQKKKVLREDSVVTQSDTLAVKKAILPVHRGIITRFKTDSAVALTFDACETITPSYFDSAILLYLLKEKIPFTLFVNGKFALRNMKPLREIAALPFVQIENHTMNHIQHMEKLSKDSIIQEVLLLEQLLMDSLGLQTRYFRFPGGNYDSLSLSEVENLGYTVVHWTFPSGDPDKRITPEQLAQGVIRQTRPGNILIFHMNGRGWSTGKALPHIVQAFKKKNYRFVKLNEVIESKINLE